MAKTYADIQKEIAALQKAAEVLKQKEVSGVIDRIKAAIASYGLTAADLGLAAGAAVADKPKRGRKPGPAKVKKAPGTAVYRDEAGHTWT
ncbi:MAG: H-NS family nucleoid-associated regulatory protein, partial [Rubrivivax sp.]